MSTERPPAEVLGALLWLRNHYDVGSEIVSKEQVLARIDAVLNEHNVSGQDAAAFRAKYPVTR